MLPKCPQTQGQDDIMYYSYGGKAETSKLYYMEPDVLRYECIRWWWLALSEHAHIHDKNFNIALPPSSDQQLPELCTKLVILFIRARLRPVKNEFGRVNVIAD